MAFDEGVPLAELDLGGDPPEGVALLGPDTVTITDGAQFTIKVDGEAADRMRFTLDDGTLGIMREQGNWTDHGSIMGSGDVTVRGAARCKVNSMGSGSLVCEREAEPAD